MPRLSLPFALGSALLLISPLATALGFGPTRNHTALGQHLNFAASVLLEADENLSRDCVTAEVLAGDNPVAARNVRAVLETTRDPSRRIVRVTTSVAMEEPVATIEVSIGCGSRIARRFVTFIDPPSLQLAEAAAASEAVTLPTSYADSRIASLADVARQADASRRARDGEVRRDDAERRPRPPRKAARPSPVVTMASAIPTAASRRPATGARRTELKPRTALAAAPRSGVARLRLDPPRALAVLSQPAAPPPLLATAATVAMASSAPPAPPGRASLGPPPPPPAIDPLLARATAAAAAAAGSGAMGSVEQQRIQALEADLARMQTDSQAMQQTVATLQARVRQAEQGRYRNALVYGLAAATLLAILVAALLWWLRPRQRSRARWFEAQANQQARSATRVGPPTSAGAASQPVPLSQPAPLTRPPPPQRPAVPPPPAASLPPPASSTSGSTTGWNTGPSSLMPTTQHSAIGGLEVTTVLGPEVSRPALDAFGSVPGRARSGGELTMEELIDLEQQAEFFVVLGQDEAAMSLLEGYIEGSGKSPLPWLQLLEIHQRRDDRDAYGQLRDSFNERFNANAPDWSFSLHSGRSLEDYPQTVALLQSLWTTPLSAMQALDRLLFRREEAEETFDFPAYRELLFLYSVAREISENVETDFGSIDLFLPLDDPPPEAERSQHGALEVDLDVSQWPEDASMSDLLGRNRPTGRRGAA